MATNQSEHDVGLAVRELAAGVVAYRHAVADRLHVDVAAATVLGHLHHDGALSPREMASRLRFSTGSVTALLDRLERAGLVSRRMDPGDRRRLIVSLTEDGARVMTEIYRDYDTTVAGAVADSALDPLELIDAVSAMSKALEAATEAIRRRP